MPHGVGGGTVGHSRGLVFSPPQGDTRDICTAMKLYAAAHQPTVIFFFKSGVEKLPNHSSEPALTRAEEMKGALLLAGASFDPLGCGKKLVLHHVQTSSS